MGQAKNGKPVRMVGARTLAQAFDTDPEMGGLKGSFGLVVIAHGNDVREVRGVIQGAIGELGAVKVPRRWLPIQGEWKAAPEVAVVFRLSDVACVELPAETVADAQEALGAPPDRPPPQPNQGPGQVVIPKLVPAAR